MDWGRESPLEADSAFVVTAISWGCCEGGLLTHSMIFKKPFFMRYWKILSTVHFKRKKLSNKSSWDFEYYLHTRDTHWYCSDEFCTYSTLPTRWHCNQFLQKYPKSKLDNTFTLKKPFVTPNFCKQNLSRIHHFEIVNSFTFKYSSLRQSRTR